MERIRGRVTAGTLPTELALMGRLTSKKTPMFLEKGASLWGPDLCPHSVTVRQFWEINGGKLSNSFIPSQLVSSLFSLALHHLDRQIWKDWKASQFGFSFNLIYKTR